MKAALLRRLFSNPIMVREMEIRASRDEGYRLFNYCGPGLYLLLLESPAVFGIVLGDLFSSWQSSTGGHATLFWSPALFLVTAWLQVIYFSHAAARFCAGSVAIERERGTLDALRLLPSRTREVFTGKFLPAVAPLLIEALVAIPATSLYCVMGAVPVSTVLAVGALNVGLVVFFGLWGMFWSVTCRDVMSALSRAFATVLGFNVVPLLLGFFLQFMACTNGAAPAPAVPVPGVGSVFTLSPLYMAGGLTASSSGGASLWTLQPWMLLAVMLTAVLTALALYRAALRGLARS